MVPYKFFQCFPEVFLIRYIEITEVPLYGIDVTLFLTVLYLVNVIRLPPFFQVLYVKFLCLINWRILFVSQGKQGLEESVTLGMHSSMILRK